MTPRDSASVTAGTGMPTGVAPSSPSSVLMMRLGARIFMPRRSSSFPTARLAWMAPGPCTHVAIMCTPANSPSFMCASNRSQ